MVRPDYLDWDKSRRFMLENEFGMGTSEDMYAVINCFSCWHLSSLTGIFFYCISMHDHWCVVVLVIACGYLFV
jgi:hypothetical protein